MLVKSEKCLFRGFCILVLLSLQCFSCPCFRISFVRIVNLLLQLIGAGGFFREGLFDHCWRSHFLLFDIFSVSACCVHRFGHIIVTILPFLWVVSFRAVEGSFSSLAEHFPRLSFHILYHQSPSEDPNDVNATSLS